MNKKLLILITSLCIICNQCQAIKWSWKHLVPVAHAYDLVTQPHHHGHNRNDQHPQQEPQAQPAQVNATNNGPAEPTFVDCFKKDLKKEGSSYLAKAVVVGGGGLAVAALGGACWYAKSYWQGQEGAQQVPVVAQAQAPAQPQIYVVNAPSDSSDSSDYSDDEDEGYSHHKSHKHHHRVSR